jgi:hypothetical protein
MSAFAAAIRRCFAGKQPPIADVSSSLRLSAAPVAFRVHVRPFLFLAVRQSQFSPEKYVVECLGLPVCESDVHHKGMI